LSGWSGEFAANSMQKARGLIGSIEKFIDMKEDFKDHEKR
jgi:hypothetical protein